MNIMMDTLAKELARKTTSEECVNLQEHKLGYGIVQFQGSNIYEHVQNTLQSKISNIKGMRYWYDKGRINKDNEGLISWETQRKSHKNSKLSRQITKTKWTSGWIGIGIGQNMERWSLRYKGHCPFCKSQLETTKHVLLCSHNEVETCWNDSIKKYNNSLKKVDTNHYLRKAILRN